MTIYSLDSNGDIYALNTPSFNAKTEVFMDTNEIFSIFVINQS